MNRKARHPALGYVCVLFAALNMAVSCLALANGTQHGDGAFTSLPFIFCVLAVLCFDKEQAP